jgi:hypothetical protein
VRIPLIVKPPVSAGIAARVVDGVFDAVDLMPTVLDLLGLPVSRSCDGVSRMEAVRHGRALPEHDSFTLSADALEACVARPPAKLKRSLVLHPVPGGRVAEAGATTLTDVEREEYLPEPSPESEALERELNRWLAPLNGAGGG